MPSDVEAELSDFATSLIEAAGGLVDWNDDTTATALVPRELAESLGQHDEAFPLSTQPQGEGLSLSLGGEFVDLAGRTLRHYVPAQGVFEWNDLPVRKSEFGSAVDAAFGWQNARGRVIEGRQVSVPYHCWWFHAILQSEETWESLISTTVNAETGLEVSLGSLVDQSGLRRTAQSRKDSQRTLGIAVRLAMRDAVAQAHAFLQRTDARQARDRNRLTDYYLAMQTESSNPNRRTKIVPSSEEIESRRRAVKLELQRKLFELEERYSIKATMKPVAHAEIVLSAIGIDVEIQRKATKRILRIYWNPVLRQLEPVACSRCGQAGWNFWFTNDTVAPLCGNCHEGKPQ